MLSFEESIWGDEDNVVVSPGTGNSSSFTYGHFDVTLLTEFKKIDAQGNETDVTGVVTISGVKINNKKVTMEGPSVDQNTGLTEYTSEERRDLNITNNSLVEVNGTVAYYTDASKKTLSAAMPFTINGYLTESQNVCGGKLGIDKGFDLKFESITIVNNRVVVDTNVVSKYKVTGTITKTEKRPIYYVDTTKTVYGYDYVVTAEGVKLLGYSLNGNAIKDIYRDVYLLDVNKTIKDYDYEVSGTGIKTYYDVISKYVRLADVNYLIEYMELGKGGDVEILPPQTGVNETNNNSFIISMFVALVLFIKSLFN